MIVVTSRFAVAEGGESEFEDRLRLGAQLLERPPGWIRSEVLRPCSLRFERERGQFAPGCQRPLHYEVKTWWRSLQDFEDWAQSPACRTARPLQDTFLVPDLLDVHEVFIESPRAGQR